MYVKVICRTIRSTFFCYVVLLSRLEKVNCLKSSPQTSLRGPDILKVWHVVSPSLSLNQWPLVESWIYEGKGVSTRLFPS